MRSLLRLLAGVALAAALASPAPAQHLGDVSITTVQQTLFPLGTACTGVSQTAVINNQGQTSHVVTMKPTGASQSQFFLVGSNDGILFTRMSDEVDAGNPASVTLTASGYYTVVEAVIICTGGTFSMTYSGSGVPPSAPAGDGLLAQIEKVLVNGTSVGTNQSGIYRVPYGNLSGILYANSAGGAFPGGSTLRIACNYSIANTQQATTFALGGSTLFVGTVPAAPCAIASWTYTAGGASANTLEIEHVVSSGFSGASGTGSGGTATNVQGITPDQVAVGTTNPVLISGVTNSSSSCVTCNLHISALGQNANDISGVGVFRTVGLAIGAGNLNPVNNTTGMTLPNNGPLGSALFATNTAVSTGTDVNVWASPPSGFSPGQTGAGATNTNPGGIMVNQNGFSQNIAVVGNASGTQTISNNTWNSGNFQSCYAQLDFTSITGAATVDVFVRTSLNGTNFLDRARFTLATSTAATQHQATGFGPTTAGLPAAPTQVLGTHSALASGSVNNGPIGGWLTFDWATVLGGGTVTGMVVGIACY